MTYPFKLVSVVMPVFNGEFFIGRSVEVVHKYLSSLGMPHEVVVVDDGSEDSTREVALEVASRFDGVRVVGYGRNLGKGAAFIYGYRCSEGDVVILYDADLDIPPQQIPVLLTTMIREGADVVITNKWYPSLKTEAPSYTDS